MKQRDLFAALAMQQLLEWQLKENKEGKIFTDKLSIFAFKIADAMVEQSKSEPLPADIENIH